MPRSRVVLVGGPDLDTRLDFMQELAADFDLCALGSNPALSSRFAAAGFRYRSYPMVRGVSPLTDARTVMALTAAFRELRPALVHTFDTKPNVYGRLAARASGVPAVIGTVPGLGSLYAHAAGPARRTVRAVYERLQRLANSTADLTVLQNESDRSELIARGVLAAGKARVIAGSGVRTDVYARSAVEPGAAAAFRRDLDIPEDAVVALMISRAIRSKGVLTFAEAAERCPGVVFVLLGKQDRESPDRLTLAECARLHRSIRWLEVHVNVVPALAAADVFVLPTGYREGVPRVLLEAAAMSLPLIATGTPGCAQIVVDGITGSIIPQDDDRALAAAVSCLAADPPFRQRLGTAARARVLEFHDLRRVAAAYGELYRETLRTAGHSSKTEGDGFAPEQQRILKAYSRRAGRTSYFGFEDASHVVRVQERQRAALALLMEVGIGDLERLNMLDVGCGSGDTLLQLLQWGGEPRRLAGIDLREEALTQARQRVAGADLRVGCATDLPWPAATFDLVQQSTVFTSILSDEMRTRVAREMTRVLKPGGAVLWYDFTIDNPFNAEVRGVSRSELAALFPDWRIRHRRVTLAAPLARRLPRSSLEILYPALAAMPWCRTHMVAVLTRH
jgi:glycosyltransferase involved in cell wall biosynthesis/SAM-dependent methyltransferase